MKPVRCLYLEFQVEPGTSFLSTGANLKIQIEIISQVETSSFTSCNSRLRQAEKQNVLGSALKLRNNNQLEPSRVPLLLDSTGFFYVGSHSHTYRLDLIVATSKKLY